MRKIKNIEKNKLINREIKNIPIKLFENIYKIQFIYIKDYK